MSHSGGQGPSENMVPLLQLPHFDQDLLKRLQRKRVRTLQDLFCMPADERREVYAFGGMRPVQDLIIIARKPQGQPGRHDIQLFSFRLLCSSALVLLQIQSHLSVLYTLVTAVVYAG